MLDRPLSGRIFFEQVIRENLDIGRPKQVQLIFNRWVTKKSPGAFRTRVITDGVVPSLHVDYKGTRVKQYHKEGQALRTETTINNTRDFYIGKSLRNLDKLRAIGFEANRRLLEVEKISHDCILTKEQLQQLNHSRQIGYQPVSALRFGDGNVQALCHAVLMFDALPVGFSNLRLRQHLAALLGLAPDDLKPGAMTYHLRRLRLHGIIERIPHTHRYRLTDFGLRTALFFTCTYDHLLRPGLGTVMPQLSNIDSSLRRSLDTVSREVNRWIQETGIAA